MTRVPAWITSVLAVAVAVLVGALVLSVVTAAGEPAHEFSGEYVDGRHGVSDVGQRWYDPEHQVFYSTDSAPVDDPGPDPVLTLQEKAGLAGMLTQ